MHRPTLGILALLLFFGGLAFTFLPIAGEGQQAWGAACLRVGILMGAIWLALPHMRGLPRWLLLALGAGLIGILLLARQPRVLLIGAIALVLAARLRTWLAEPPPPRPRRTR
jgi:hypothetical protein